MDVQWRGDFPISHPLQQQEGVLKRLLVRRIFYVYTYIYLNRLIDGCAV